MRFTTKRLCRAGIIAALYVALTYVFMPFAFGPLQIRPAEALCILPLFFPEAVPALFAGCALANIVSQYSVFDVVIGSFTTLAAAFCTYQTGKHVKKEWLRLFLGGLFPVLFNAFSIPFVIVIILGDTATYATLSIAYFTNVSIFLLTQTVWVYGGGVPLYFTVRRLRRKRLAFFD